MKGLPRDAVEGTRLICTRGHGSVRRARTIHSS